MLKKILKVSAVLLLVGFSFFYTEKVTIIARNSDPIMRAIKEEEKDKKISNVNPIVNKDEYKTGINGCEIDVDESYSKMRSVGEFKEELIVMKEVSNDKDLTNKYVIGGNNKDKKVSLIFFVNKDINNDLTNYINEKDIKVNYFIDGKYLEENLITVKFLSENNNIYYLGMDNKYSDEYKITYKHDDIVYVEGEYIYNVLDNDYKDQIDVIKNEKMHVLLNSNGMKGFTYTYEVSDKSFKINSYLDFSQFDYKKINNIDQSLMPISYFEITNNMKYETLIKELQNQGYKCVPTR